MKVLFDTNVIVDALTERDVSYKPSRNLLRFVATGEVKGYITAKQITDFYYIVRKYFATEAQRRAIIRTIFELFEIIPTTKSDIAYCLNSNTQDLEDALLDEVCSVNCIDYLVTNNTKHFEKSKSIIFTPEQILKLIDVDK